MALRFLTAGESHGQALVGILEGVPSGLRLVSGDIDADLRRRQGGHGRGGRMKIEADHAEIVSGVRWGCTLGSPIALVVHNKDWKNWQDGMSADPAKEGSIAPVTRPRPGHADLAGAMKYALKDIRDVLERSSARETAIRVALGAVCKRFLKEFGFLLGSFVTRIGKVDFGPCDVGAEGLRQLHMEAESSPVRCPDKAVAGEMMREIDEASSDGDSLGGVFQVFATGVPPGLGSHVHWDRRLDGRLAQAIMSVQAIKGVEVGLGFMAAERRGSEVMDEILAEGKPSGPGSLQRKSNNAGGIEGGISNGLPIVLKAAMKPIPTLKRPLRSVDLSTGMPVEAAYERSDVCAVPAAAVIAEAMVAFVLADCMLEKFGGDSMAETRRNFDSYLESLGRWP